MQNIINIIVFLFILGSIIIIHELGHFLAAKFFGVYCGQFSIGFGPKIWSKKGKETEYELRALPFGGFVAMAGEEDQADNENMQNVPYERTLKGIKAYQKIIIFFAGVLMNFILAIIIIFGLNLTSGKLPVNNAQLGVIAEGSAAETAGLKKGDVIQQIDIAETGKTYLITNFKDIDFTQKGLSTSADSVTMKITVDRNGEKQVVNTKVDYNQDKSAYVLGITQATRSMNFVESIQYTFVTFGEMSVAIVGAIGQLITNFTKTIGQMSGPAGIYQITAEVTESGQVSHILSLLAMLSVNVGIFNLMPIPGLDGCQILFVAAEKVIGRELPQKLKLALQMIGLGLVMLLMIIVTYQDIMRIFG
ncbi:MAG: M50 family metallopeptidase [Coprobacillus sp.]